MANDLGELISSCFEAILIILLICIVVCFVAWLIKGEYQDGIQEDE